MDIIKIEPTLAFLKESNFGYYGISRLNSKNKNTNSIEPVAIVAFVLSKMNELNIFEKKQFIGKILKAKSTTGSFYTINKKTSVWATAQACIALNELGCETTEYFDSIMWLCKSQNKNGGWSYNGVIQNTSIIHSFYTVLILKRFKGIYKEVDKTLFRNIEYLKTIRDDLREKATSRLIALYLLDILGEKQNSSTITLILDNYIKEIIVKKDDEPYIDFDVENDYQYYIGFYFPAIYLLVRKFISPKDSFSQFLIRHLLITMEPDGCWKPNMINQKPTSWATALSIYTLFTWESDCKKKNLIPKVLPEKEIIRRLRTELEDRDMKNEFVMTCPLNQGKCNLKNKIQEEYDEKKVFLDIPYNLAYEDYENQIIHTLKAKGLIPVLAKDSTQSSILLCKVCQKIQSCRYGVADISEAKANVYFELGLLYGISRKCAILKKADINLPTDLQGKEYIEYANTREVGKKLTQWIKDNIGDQL